MLLEPFGFLVQSFRCFLILWFVADHGVSPGFNMRVGLNVESR